MIVYTIGSTKSYNEAITSGVGCKKAGKTDDYQGGIIFKTEKEAFLYIYSKEFLQIDWGDNKPRYPKDFSVYGVVVDTWEKDIYFSDEDHRFYLLNDSQLVFI